MRWHRLRDFLLDIFAKRGRCTCVQIFLQVAMGSIDSLIDDKVVEAEGAKPLAVLSSLSRGCKRAMHIGAHVKQLVMEEVVSKRFRSSSSVLGGQAVACRSTQAEMSTRTSLSRMLVCRIRLQGWHDLFRFKPDISMFSEK